MPKINVVISDAQHIWLLANSDKLRTKSAIVRDLIESEMRKLDEPVRLPAYRVGAGEELTKDEKLKLQLEEINHPSNSSQKIFPPLKLLGDDVGRESEGTPKKGPSNKTSSLHSIAARKKIAPEKLKPFWDKIEAFWKVKKGSKSLQAFTLQLTELEKILDDLGKDILIEQLDLACLSGTWKAINHKRTVQFLETAKKNKPEPEMKHPAYKVYTAEDHETSTSNPVLKELF